MLSCMSYGGGVWPQRVGTGERRQCLVTPPACCRGGFRLCGCGWSASKQAKGTYVRTISGDGWTDRSAERGSNILMDLPTPLFLPSNYGCYLLELRDPNDPDLPPVPLLLFPKLENGYRKISRNLSWAPAATIMILL
jgi:hypothetical protein